MGLRRHGNDVPPQPHCFSTWRATCCNSAPTARIAFSPILRDTQRLPGFFTHLFVFPLTKSRLTIVKLLGKLIVEGPRDNGRTTLIGRDCSSSRETGVGDAPERPALGGRAFGSQADDGDRVRCRGLLHHPHAGGDRAARPHLQPRHGLPVRRDAGAARAHQGSATASRSSSSGRS